MKQQLIALGVIAATATVAAADKKPYTLADLKTLISQKSYKEAVAHLHDVTPAERNADWQAVAADAATGYIKGLSNDSISTKILEIERLDSDVPAILKSTTYTKVRTEVGVDAFGRCYGDNYWFQECSEHAWKFMQADPTNTDLALKLGKVVRRGLSSYWSALKYFKIAFTAKSTKSMCSDDDVKLAIVSGFAVATDDDVVPTAKQLATTCWDAIKKPLLAAYTADSEGGYTRKNACSLLKTKKALTAEQAKSCK